MSVLDEYSFSTVPIEMHFGEIALSVATAFIWKNANNYFLITNWHNVTGKDPFTGKHLSATAAEPDRIKIWWNKKDKSLGKCITWTNLLDKGGNPLWYTHPRLGNKIDVVALPVNPPSEAEPYPINALPQRELRLMVGCEVFILGYPFGLGAEGLPIWKRGSIASEPAVLSDSKPFIIVDSASRPGMSGAPVMRRSWGSHSMHDGTAVMDGQAATRFIGIYSGRLYTQDKKDAQLGLVWPQKLIGETVFGEAIDRKI